MERKLAAILVADIVGYSAQMERDEAGTFERVAERRTGLFEPEISRHHGRIFKLTGDGILAEFASAVDAVECAVALQAGLAERNKGLSNEHAIQARIGVNLAEVIVDGDDRFGEGVNIAARLEQLADPGSICVSEKVAREVERKLAFGFEWMGEKRVKNIAEPIRVYRVTADLTKGTRRKRLAANRVAKLGFGTLAAALFMAAVSFWLQDVASRKGPPMLAVLPFANLSGDPAQDYLGPGIADGIITMLSTSPLVRVMSRTSSFSIEPTTDPLNAARTLQVDYVLEGSLRREGKTFHVSTQLVSARDGSNLWASQLEQDGKDIVELQQAIASRVYASLAGIRGEVTDAEIGLTWRKWAPSLEEYDFHLRGASEFLKWTDESKHRAWEIWSKGLEEYPDSALLRLELAALHHNRAFEGLSADRWQDIQRAMTLIREAETQTDLSRLEEWLLHYVKANVMVAATGDFEASAQEAEAAHAMVPYDPLSSTDLSFVMANAGHPEIALQWAKYAVANEAVVPDWYRDNLAWAHLMANQPREAVLIYESIQWYCVPCKAVALVRVGRVDDAKSEIAAHSRRYPDWTLEDVRTWPSGRHSFMVERQMRPYLDDLRNAGLKDRASN